MHTIVFTTKMFQKRNRVVGPTDRNQCMDFVVTLCKSIPYPNKKNNAKAIPPQQNLHLQRIFNDNNNYYMYMHNTVRQKTCCK